MLLITGPNGNWIEVADLLIPYDNGRTNCKSAMTWNGECWVEHLVSRDQIMKNFSHFELYIHSLEKYGELSIYPNVYNDPSRNWWDFVSSNSSQTTELYIRFRIVTRGGGVFNVDEKLLSLLNAKTGIRIYGTMGKCPQGCNTRAEFGNLYRQSSSSNSVELDGYAREILTVPAVNFSFKSANKTVNIRTSSIELRIFGNDGTEIIPLTMCVERY